MATESTDDLDHRIKELKRETREEELRQLKANAKVRWVTPTALAAVLPLMAGFCLWIFGELKQYNEGYNALKEKDKLLQEKKALREEKDSLNVEISTLLQLKGHYADQAKQLGFDVNAKQETIDKMYIRAVFTNAEIIYSLDLLNGVPPGPKAKEMDAIKAAVAQLPKERADELANVLQRYELSDTIVSGSSDMAAALQKALGLFPASDWARDLRPMPSGAILPGRSLMFTDTPHGRRFYDVTEGRFLTQEEAKKAR